MNNKIITSEVKMADNEKKSTIMERMNKRNKDRQNDLEVKLEQRNKENLQFEGVDYFSQTFAERTHDIELRLRNINETAAKKTTAPTVDNNANLIQLFTNITIQIQELQQYLTSSTIFLTDYKIKACQNILTELQHNSEEIRQRLLPKKKFGFSNKKTIATTTAKIIKPSHELVDGTKSATSTTAAFEWTLSNLKNEYICLKADEVNGKDITISNLQHCFIELQGHAGSLQLSHTTDCILLSGPVARSLFAEYCERLTIAVACQQLRLHSSIKCRLYLQVTCRAIIEDSSGIELSPYAYDYESLDEDYKLSGLNRTLNNYEDVADFNWLSPDVPSPNWRIVKDDCENPDWSEKRKEFKAKLTL